MPDPENQSLREMTEHFSHDHSYYLKSLKVLLTTRSE